MKIDGNGQAKVLTTEELKKLFECGLQNDRDRLIFAICLFTGCRISECLALQWSDLKGNVLTLRKANTKGKAKTRSISIHPRLQEYLNQYDSSKKGQHELIFKGRSGAHLSRYSADKILKKACDRVGLEGVSTHSFRRTALTQMHNAGVPLRHIQSISGHADLSTLQRYLEVSEQQRDAAIATLGF